MIRKKVPENTFARSVCVCVCVCVCSCVCVCVHVCACACDATGWQIDTTDTKPSAVLSLLLSPSISPKSLTVNSLCKQPATKKENTHRVPQHCIQFVLHNLLVCTQLYTPSMRQNIQYKIGAMCICAECWDRRGHEKKKKNDGGF